MSEILSTLSGILWGLPLTFGLIGLGLYLTVRGKFWQFRHFGDCVRHMFGKNTDTSDTGDDYGKISKFQAFSIATGAAVGVGNIGGVASAIALGGPGAIFWMWVTALVGMMTKMVEVTLGVHYRSKDQNGKIQGGPSYYIEKGFKEIGMVGGPIFATCFALSLFLELFFGMENFTVSEAVSSTFNLPQIPIAILYWAVGKSIILGGVKVIGKVSKALLPFMSLFYIAGGLITLGVTAQHLPGTFALIFKSAFQPIAAVSGFAGASFVLVMRTGIARGLYSNEAGWGTSPMAHAMAHVSHPVEQGMMGVLEVFVDTIIICTITGLVIINTGVWNSGLSGATLALEAFKVGMGQWGAVVLTISLVMFCLTTHIGWFVMFESTLRYLFRQHEKAKEIAVWALKLVFHGTPSMILTIVTVSNGMIPAEVWLFADITSSIPTYINIFAVFLLSNKFFALLRHYNKTKLGINEKNVDENMSVFSKILLPFEERDLKIWEEKQKANAQIK